jgi:hypothetical protein
VSKDFSPFFQDYKEILRDVFSMLSNVLSKLKIENLTNNLLGHRHLIKENIEEWVLLFNMHYGLYFFFQMSSLLSICYSTNIYFICR